MGGVSARARQGLAGGWERVPGEVLNPLLGPFQVETAFSDPVFYTSLLSLASSKAFGERCVVEGWMALGCFASLWVFYFGPA